MKVEQLIRGNLIRYRIAVTNPESDLLGMLDGRIGGVTLADEIRLDGEVDVELEQVIALAERVLAVAPEPVPTSG